jgi:hypothetical protein
VLAPFLTFLFVASLLTGCLTNRPTTRPTIYTGPTLPMADVISAINTNNRQLPTLWAHVASFDAWIYDEKKHENYVNGDGGTLLYRKSRDLRLTVKKPFADVMTLGSNAERYWLVVPEGPKSMWWGYARNAGKACANNMPIRPDLVLEVLGIGDINTDLTKAPFPTMRFYNDDDSYILDWSAPAIDNNPPRWIVQREVWYARTTLLPKTVLLYDANGRVVLRAWLTQHVPVEIPGVPEAQWPKVATHYQIYFPDSGSRMVLQLSDLRPSKQGTPNNASFTFPAQPPVPDDRIIQIDANCGP